MAQKAMVDGTARKISGGKTMVDGTVYSINGGKTMVDGTIYEISMAQPITVTIRLDVDSMNYGNLAESTTGLTLRINGKSYATPPDGTKINDLGNGFMRATYTVSVPAGSSLYVVGIRTSIYGSAYGGVKLNGSQVSSYDYTMALTDNAYISVTCVSGDYSYRTVSIKHPYAS